MKKLLSILTILMVLITLIGCSSKKPVDPDEPNLPTIDPDKQDPKDDPKQEEPDPEKDPGQEIQAEPISMADFFKVVAKKAGYWDTANQFYDFRIRFELKDDKYYMIQEMVENNEAIDSFILELNNAEYNCETGIYTIQVVDDNGANLNHQFVNFSSELINNQILKAENYFDSYHLCEYLFISEEEIISQISAKYILVSADFDPAYLSNVEFHEDGTFLMVENNYVGLGNFKGTYQIEEDKYICQVEETDMQGFLGGDVTEIIFSIIDENKIKIETSICSSIAGDTFMKTE